MDDLIYREDAIKAACKGFCHPGACCPDSGCKELDTIKNLPAVKQKTGKWLPDSRFYDIRFVCSACKNTESVATVNFKPIWKYCPNCGAKMEGEQNV